MPRVLLAGFSGLGNSIYYIIPLFEKCIPVKLVYRYYCQAVNGYFNLYANTVKNEVKFLLVHHSDYC